METRDKIIDQTFDLLLLKGYDSVSISDIQHGLGISRGLLYHYFGSKEALFLEAVKRKFTNCFQIDFDQIRNYDLELMTDYIVMKYRTLDSEILKGRSILNYDFLYYRAMQQSDELTQIYNQIRWDEQLGWLIALENSKSNGKLRSGINLEKLALQYIYVTDGVWLSAVTPSLDIDLIISLKQALEAMNELIINT